jgi:uncharacterized protein YodC (DUF2158 family)
MSNWKIAGGLKRRGEKKMAEQCKDCRWYSGNQCEVRNTSMNANNSSCGTFVNHTDADGDTHCKSCRWFDGHKCEERDSTMNALNSKCGKYTAFR